MNDGLSLGPFIMQTLKYKTQTISMLRPAVQSLEDTKQAFATTFPWESFAEREVEFLSRTAFPANGTQGQRTECQIIPRK